MSATASIITSTETGRIVPASAVKTLGGQSYVEVFTPALSGSDSPAGAESDTPPSRITVTTGLSDGTNEIIESGVTEGMQVVTQTLTDTTSTTVKSAAAQSTSLFGAGGATRAGGAAGGGANVRFISR
jgi:hypothetical protein